MKAPFFATLQIALLWIGTPAKGTLTELDMVDQAEPASSPALSFRLSPTLGPDTVGDPLSRVVDSAGLIPPAFLEADDAFAARPLGGVQEKDQSGLLISELPWSLAARLYCASMEKGFPYINLSSWAAASSPAWALAFSYSSLTSHEERLFDLNLPHKYNFLSLSGDPGSSGIDK